MHASSNIGLFIDTEGMAPGPPLPMRTSAERRADARVRPRVIAGTAAGRFPPATAWRRSRRAAALRTVAVLFILNSDPVYGTRPPRVSLRPCGGRLAGSSASRWREQPCCSCIRSRCARPHVRCDAPRRAAGSIHPRSAFRTLLQRMRDRLSPRRILLFVTREMLRSLHERCNESACCHAGFHRPLACMQHQRLDGREQACIATSACDDDDAGRRSFAHASPCSGRCVRAAIRRAAGRVARVRRTTAARAPCASRSTAPDRSCVRERCRHARRRSAADSACAGRRPSSRAARTAAA